MREETIYLDSSVIIKRYIKESGSEEIKKIYCKAYSGENILSYNIWNICEVLEVFNRARALKRISEETYHVVRRRFMLDVKRMLRLRALV